MRSLVSRRFQAVDRLRLTPLRHRGQGSAANNRSSSFSSNQKYPQGALSVNPELSKREQHFNSKQVFHINTKVILPHEAPVMPPTPSVEDIEGLVVKKKDEVVDQVRQTIYSLLSASNKSLPDAPQFISTATVQQGLPENTRRSLRDPLYSGLVQTVKKFPEWFTVKDNGLKVGLTEEAWGIGSASIMEQQRELQAIPSVQRKVLFVPRKSDKRRMWGQAATAAEKALAQLLNAKNDVDLNKCKNAVSVHATSGEFVGYVDVSKPPITEKDLPEIMEKRTLARAGLGMISDFGDETTHRRLFSAGERVPQLKGLEVYDRKYRAGGKYTPSEMAHACIQYVPTYFVEAREILDSLPRPLYDLLSAWLPLKCGFRQDEYKIFAHYPMLFAVRFVKFEPMLVKLNLDNPAVASHPKCGAADEYMRRFSKQDYVGGHGLVHKDFERSQVSKIQTVDLQIFQILARHLPRVSVSSEPDPDERNRRRYEFFPLVPWITSFAPAELDIINSVPQPRIVTILQKYLRIFQLSDGGRDPNLYFASFPEFKERRRKIEQPQNLKESKKERDLAQSKNIKDRFASAASSAKDTEEGNEVCENDTAIASRVLKFQTAVEEEFVGMEDILAEDHKKEGTEPREAPEPSAPKLKEDPSEDAANPSEVENDTVDQQTEQTGRSNPSMQELGEEYIPTSPFESLLVRRIPPNIAPRSLSNFDVQSTPEPELMEKILKFVVPGQIADSMGSSSGAKVNPERYELPSELHSAPPVVENSPSEVSFMTGPFSNRWVQLNKIYESLTTEQKRLLRPYKGLANFLRLHGKEFEVSRDMRYVISLRTNAVDPPPLIPTQTDFRLEERIVLPQNFDNTPVGVDKAIQLIGEKERVMYQNILRDAQVPTNRGQLAMLDPLNPLLNVFVLLDEMYDFMPDHPVPLRELLKKLPPVMKAAVPGRFMTTLEESPRVVVWREDGMTIIQKAEFVSAQRQRSFDRYTSTDDAASLEETIELLTKLIPPGGIHVQSLAMKCPPVVNRFIRHDYKNHYIFLISFPKLFYLENASQETQYVHLVSHLKSSQVPLAGDPPKEPHT